MKKLFTTILLFFSLINILRAQKLENKIPNNVDVVITANAKNLFDLISVPEIESNFLVEMVLDNINGGKEEKITSIEDLGVNIKSNAYYFFKQGNHDEFHAVFLELKNRKQYEATLSDKKVREIEKENGYSYIKAYRNITIWNDGYLLLIGGKSSSDVIKNYAFSVLKNTAKTSLIANRKFQKAKKKNSLATIWVRDYGRLMTDLAFSLNHTVFSSLGFKDKDITGVNEMKANLFFEKDNINLKIDISVDDEIKDVFKKMYNQKISKNLLKHLNTKEDLAFLSFSVNTEEVLLGYPNLIKSIYTKTRPDMEEEIKLGVDLFSLIIDEKAIGELVTGDVLLILNDLSKKEVAYTTYEYDENYKRKETLATKEEIVPDITFMLGTKEDELLNKLFQVAKKYKVLDIDKNIYQFTKKSKSIPFNLYVFVKNNVLMFTTSKERAFNLYNTTKNYNSSEYSKMIRKNSFVTFIDIHKILKGFSEVSLSKPETKAFDFASENLKEVHLKMSKAKGDRISTELKLKTSDNHENSLKLLLAFFNYMK